MRDICNLLLLAAPLLSSCLLTSGGNATAQIAAVERKEVLIDYSRMVFTVDGSVNKLEDCSSRDLQCIAFSRFKFAVPKMCVEDVDRLMEGFELNGDRIVLKSLDLHESPPSGSYYWTSDPKIIYQFSVRKGLLQIMAFPEPVTDRYFGRDRPSVIWQIRTIGTSVYCS